jgi:hypothetical protein
MSSGVLIPFPAQTALKQPTFKPCTSDFSHVSRLQLHFHRLFGPFNGYTTAVPASDPGSQGLYLPSYVLIWSAMSIRSWSTGYCVAVWSLVTSGADCHFSRIEVHGDRCCIAAGVYASVRSSLMTWYWTREMSCISFKLFNAVIS